jgi:hypothetical protein
MPSTANCSQTHTSTPARTAETHRRVQEGTAGRLKNPARSTCPRTSTLRISHFPDPHTRRYPPSRPVRTPTRLRLLALQGAETAVLTTEGSR